MRQWNAILQISSTIVVLSLGCDSIRQSPRNDGFPPKMAFQVIRNLQSSQRDVLDAMISVRRMAPSPDELRMWNEVANDASYPTYRRRWALLQIFERYIPPNSTLGELCKILTPSSWLTSQTQLRYVNVIAGRLPFKGSAPGDHILFISPELPSSASCFVYLRLDMAPGAGPLWAALKQGDSAAASTIVREIAIDDAQDASIGVISKGIPVTFSPNPKSD